MRTVLIIIITAVICTGCAKKYGIERKTVPAGRVDLELRREGCALIRSRNCDLFMEYISYRSFAELLKNPLFYDKRKKDSPPRLPAIHFFHILIYNTGRSPLKISGIRLKYGDREMTPLTEQQIGKRFHSPSYGTIRLAELARPLRLVGDAFCMKKVNFGDDVIRHDFPFINPGDRIIRIVAFDWIPLQYRDFTLTVEIADLEEKFINRSFSVSFDRKEFRTSGNKFRDRDSGREEEEDDDDGLR